MAVAFDVSGVDAPSNFGVTSCTTASFTIASTSNRAALLILAMGGNGSTSFTSSCAGTSGSAVSGTDSGTARTQRILAHGVIAPASGSQTATMSWTTAQDAVLAAIVFNGVDQTSPFINGTSANGATGAPSITPTGSGANNLSCAALNTSGWAPSGATQTTRVSNQDNGSHVLTATTGAAGATHAWNDAVQPFVALAVHVQEPQAPREQEGFRWRKDDGSETTATWHAAQDTNVTAPLSANIRLRALINATGDPASTAYTLYHQKNGAGGYVAVPVGASQTVAPTVEAADCTESGNNTATTSWAVSYPAYVSGDLLVFHVASDANVTHNWPATGPNGETINTIVDSTGGTAQRASGFWFVGSATTGASTLTVTPSATEQWTAVVLKVPAGEFNSTTPIQTNTGTDNDTTADTSWDTPAWTADATAGGRVVCFAAHDVVTTSATPGGWSTLIARDRGAVGCTLAARDSANTASESISSASFTKSSETDSSFGYVINGAVVANEVYIATSSNITAGGEATTALLTAPSGKTTSDFVTGRMWDDENGSDSIDITTDDYTELEWCLYAQSPAVNTDYFDFRVYAGSSALDTYTVTPRWTIGSAGATTNLSATEQGDTLASASAVEGPTADLALAEQDDTLAAASTVSLAAAFSATEQDDTLSAAHTDTYYDAPVTGELGVFDPKFCNDPTTSGTVHKIQSYVDVDWVINPIPPYAYPSWWMVSQAISTSTDYGATWGAATPLNIARSTDSGLLTNHEVGTLIYDAAEPEPSQRWKVIWLQTEWDLARYTGSPTEGWEIVTGYRQMMRTAPDVTGPWSDPITLLAGYLYDSSTWGAPLFTDSGASFVGEPGACAHPSGGFYLAYMAAASGSPPADTIKLVHIHKQPGSPTEWAMDLLGEPLNAADVTFFQALGILYPDVFPDWINTARFDAPDIVKRGDDYFLVFTPTESNNQYRGVAVVRFTDIDTATLNRDGSSYPVLEWWVDFSADSPHVAYHHGAGTFATEAPAAGFTYSLLIPGAPEPFTIVQTGVNLPALASLSAEEQPDALSASATVGAGAITASLTATEASDALAASVQVAVTASLSAAESNDAFVASSQVAVAASLAATEADDVLSASAVAGTACALTAQEASDSLSSSAALTLTASLTAQESLDALAATGTVSLSASAALVEGDDSLASDTAVALVASAALVEGDDALSASAVAGTAGEFTAQEQDDALGASAAVAVSASLVAQEQSDSAVAASVLSLAANLSAQEASDALASAATVSLAAALAITEQDDPLLAEASNVSGLALLLTVQESGDTVVSGAVVGIACALSSGEQSDTGVGSATVASHAALAANEEWDTASGAAAFALTANFSAQEQDDTLVALATAEPPRVADLDAQESDDALTARLNEASTEASPGGGIELRRRRRPSPPRQSPSAPSQNIPQVVELPVIIAQAQMREGDDGHAIVVSITGTPTEVLRRRRAAAVLLLAA